MKRSWVKHREHQSLLCVKEAMQVMPHIDPCALTPITEDHIIKAIPPCVDLGKMGLLILAGGQGTRLGYHGPKGCFTLPLSPGKSLFQILFEKIKAKGSDLCVAVITSPLNYWETILHLRAHNWFGLDLGVIDFLQQELMPVWDHRGRLLLNHPNHIALSPAGNGKALFHLRHSAVWNKWKQRGIRYVQIIPIDNALAEPFDGELLACHETHRVQLVLRGIHRLSACEKLGIIGMRGRTLAVQEYSEVPEGIKMAKRKGGIFAYPLGNSGLFSCSLDLIDHVFKTSFVLPWHWVRKGRIGCARSEKGGKWQRFCCWQIETFIFDFFAYAKSFKVLASHRKNCFAPLKNLFGPYGLKTVLEAIRSKKT